MIPGRVAGKDRQGHVGCIASCGHRGLLSILLALLVRKIQDEHAAYLAEAQGVDMGYDDCPVCVAAR